MNTYEQLREILDAHPATAPQSTTIDEILRRLFTPDEAALAINMSFKAKSAESLAAVSSISENEALKHLESMANKGIIYSKKKDGKHTYGLVPLIPGVFEFPFMKASQTPNYKELGELWEKYHTEALGASFSGNPTPLIRIVAVEKSFQPKDRIHPYDDVRHLINNSSYLAVAECACRVSLGKCDKPKDVCLIFDGSAEFLVERGFARAITKEEGIHVLDRSEEAGLVHTSNNNGDRASVICNCCPCCCTVLRGRTQLKHTHAFEPSRFEAQVRTAECTGCGICADKRCPVKAISISDNVAAVNQQECIGCGLCVSGCPADAITLIDREHIPSVPPNVQDLGLTIVKEKGRLERFIAVMQK